MAKVRIEIEMPGMDRVVIAEQENLDAPLEDELWLAKHLLEKTRVLALTELDKLRPSRQI